MCLYILGRVWVTLGFLDTSEYLWIFLEVPGCLWVCWGGVPQAALLLGVPVSPHTALPLPVCFPMEPVIKNSWVGVQLGAGALGSVPGTGKSLKGKQPLCLPGVARERLTCLSTMLRTASCQVPLPWQSVLPLSCA